MHYLYYSPLTTPVASGSLLSTRTPRSEVGAVGRGNLPAATRMPLPIRQRQPERSSSGITDGHDYAAESSVEIQPTPIYPSGPGSAQTGTFNNSPPFERNPSFPTDFSDAYALTSQSCPQPQIRLPRWGMTSTGVVYQIPDDIDSHYSNVPGNTSYKSSNPIAASETLCLQYPPRQSFPPAKQYHDQISRRAVEERSYAQSQFGQQAPPSSGRIENGSNYGQRQSHGPRVKSISL
jgi:hypothetical protein